MLYWYCIEIFCCFLQITTSVFCTPPFSLTLGFLYLRLEILFTVNMTQVTINVSLTSGHSEGELYFLEGEGRKALGVEHRSLQDFSRQSWDGSTGKAGQWCIVGRLFMVLSLWQRDQGQTSSSGSGKTNKGNKSRTIKYSVFSLLKHWLNRSSGMKANIISSEAQLWETRDVQCAGKLPSWKRWKSIWNKVDRCLARYNPRVEANNAKLCNTRRYNANPCSTIRTMPCK